MKAKTKVIMKRALIESVPFMIVFIVIGIGIWLQALIIQDNITLAQAELYSYILLGVLIFFEVISLIYDKARDIEKRQLIEENDDLNKKIEEFEKEKERIENIK